MPTWKDIRLVIICTIIALASNFQYAFSSTYLNTPVASFKDYINISLAHMGHEMDETSYAVVWDLIQNIWFVGFFIGIWLSPLLNDRLGRKYGFMVANTLNLVAAILQFLGVWLYQPVILFVGRSIASVCTAVSFQANILYLQESPPTHSRGSISYLSEIWYAGMCIVGMLLGTDEVLGNNLPVLLAVNILPCALAVGVLFFIPDTPKFLLINKNNREAAEDSVRFFHGADEDVAAVLKEVEMEAAEEATELSCSWREVADLVREPYLRKAFLLSCAALQNTVPFWAFIYNSTQFLTDMNIDPRIAKWSSTCMATLYFIATIVGGYFIDRLGRRWILLPFSVLNHLCIVAFVVFALLQKDVDEFKYAGTAAILMFGLTYGAGVGAISWFISSEMTPLKYRSIMQSACYSVNTIAVVIATFTLLPLYGAIGPYAFLILFTLPSCFCLAYIIRYLPETKGREIYEIIEELKGN